MAANDDMLDPAIEAMMMRAPFNGLTPDEQALALASAGSAGDYDRMRAALLGARRELALEAPDLAPRRSTLDSLHAAMAARRPASVPSRRFSLAALLARPVPLYQPALAFAVLVIVALGYMAGRGEAPRERIVYVQSSPAAATAPVLRIDTEAIVQRVVDSIKAELGRSQGDASAGAPVAYASSTQRARDRRGRERKGEAAAIDTVMRIANRTMNARVVMPEGNQFVGLGNLPGLDRQRRGKSLAEDSVAGRFHAKMVSERL